MRSLQWVGLAVGVLLVGCQPESQPTRANSASSVAANANAPEPSVKRTPEPEPTPTPEPEKQPEATKAPVEAPAKVPTVADASKISPAATDGWSKTDVSPRKLAETLDTSLSDIKSATGRFRLVLDKGKEGAGHDQGEIVIADSTRYSIDWFRSHKLGTILRVRANGTYRRELTEKGWGPIERLSEQKSRDGLPLVKIWKDACSKLMFRPVIDRKPIWSPLITEFQAQGYSVRTEIKTMEVNGKPRPFYRFVVFKSDPKATRYEMRFDGIRMVPLTIKIEEPGKELVQWSGEWSFSQPIDPNAFNIEFN